MSSEPRQSMEEAFERFAAAAAQAFRPLVTAMVTAMGTFAVQLDRALWDAYRKAGQPHGTTIEGRNRWLEEMRPTRERHCHCLCARWDHLGVCIGVAETEVMFTTELLGVRNLPMCQPCADSVLEQTAASIPA